MMVVPTGKILVAEFSNPKRVIAFSVSITHTSELAGASTIETTGYHRPSTRQRLSLAFPRQ